MDLEDNFYKIIFKWLDTQSTRSKNRRRKPLNEKSSNKIRLSSNPCNGSGRRCGSATRSGDLCKMKRMALNVNICRRSKYIHQQRIVIRRSCFWIFLFLPHFFPLPDFLLAIMSCIVAHAPYCRGLSAQILPPPPPRALPGAFGSDAPGRSLRQRPYRRPIQTRRSVNEGRKWFIAAFGSSWKWKTSTMQCAQGWNAGHKGGGGEGGGGLQVLPRYWGRRKRHTTPDRLESESWWTWSVAIYLPLCGAVKAVFEWNSSFLCNDDTVTCHFDFDQSAGGW